MSGVLVSIGPIQLTQLMNPRAPSPVQALPSVPGTSNRWWAGSVCGMFYFYAATELSVIIQVPSQDPQYWYWIGLSSWDNNWSYNQIGFGEYGGKWYFYPSRSIWTQNDELVIIPELPCRVYPGYTYKFVMKAYSTGYVYYKLYQKSGSGWIFKKSISRKTGGTRFFVCNRITHFSTYYCFTNFEESMPASPAPPYDFKFQETRVDGTAFNYWWNFYSGPVPSGVVIRYGWDSWPDKPYVLVDNP